MVPGGSQGKGHSREDCRWETPPKWEPLLVACLLLLGHVWGLKFRTTYTGSSCPWRCATCFPLCKAFRNTVQWTVGMVGGLTGIECQWTAISMAALKWDTRLALTRHHAKIVPPCTDTFSLSDSSAHAAREKMVTHFNFAAVQALWL